MFILIAKVPSAPLEFLTINCVSLGSGIVTCELSVCLIEINEPSPAKVTLKVVADVAVYPLAAVICSSLKSSATPVARPIGDSNVTTPSADSVLSATFVPLYLRIYFEPDNLILVLDSSNVVIFRLNFFLVKGTLTKTVSPSEDTVVFKSFDVKFSDTTILSIEVSVVSIFISFFSYPAKAIGFDIFIVDNSNNGTSVIFIFPLLSVVFKEASNDISFPSLYSPLS